MIKIFANSKVYEIPAGMNLEDFLQFLGINSGRCLVELNGKVILSADFSKTQLKASDTLEIMKLVAGG